MAFFETSREYWEGKPNSEDFFKIVDKCVNSKPYRGKRVRYGKSRIVIDGSSEASCWLWKKGEGCIVEPRIDAVAARTVKSELSRVGFLATDHENRPTIDIYVTIDQLNDSHAWAALELALEKCVVN